MAKRKCKVRSVFRLKQRCLRCDCRRKCRRRVKRNIRRFTMVVVIALLSIMLIGIVCLIASAATAAKYEKEEKFDTIRIVETRHQEELSSCQDKPQEIKTINSAEREADEATSNQFVEVVEEVQFTFSEDEKIAMGKTLYIEARGECKKGRIAVIAVILNRLRSGREEYGAENGNVMEVITYPGAFAYPEDMTDEFFLNCPEYELCMESVEAAIAGEDPTREHFTEGARHFYSLVEPLSESEAAKREGIDIYKIGNQAFHNDMN